MSFEHSRKLIHEIAAQRETDDYIEGLLKGPEMQADMERAAAETVPPTKWELLTKDTETIQPQPPTPDKEMER